MAFTGSAPNKTYQRSDGVRTGAAVNVTADNNGVNNTAALADARENDLATAINTSWQINGNNQPSANLPMNSKKFTGLAQGSARTDSLRIDQVQDGDFLYATVGGTADAITLTLTPTSGGPVEGMTVVFIPASDNTTATTIDLDTVGAVALQYNAAALVGGELKAGLPARATFDGSVWQLENPYVITAGSLASTANGKGASLVGIEDSGTNFAATNVEAALAELFGDLPATATTSAEGIVELATDAEVRAATTDKILQAGHLETASAAVGLTDAATIAVDWDTGINFTVTLGGNRTLGTPTNGQPGTWRSVLFTQDGTGSRTLAFNNSGTDYIFPGGAAPTLSTAAASEDRLFIFCRSASIFEVYAGGIGLA